VRRADGTLDGGAADATKARLLDAAEALLAERGFAGMSIRALAARAGASVSAAHYHFGSKRGLVTAVFVARLEPINAARLARLEALVERAAPHPPRLEDVVDSLVRPSIEAWRQSEALGRPTTPHILAQLHADRAARLDDLKRRLFEPLMERYLDVLARVLPDQDDEALRVGLAFVIGMMLHVVGGHLEADGPEAAPRSVEQDAALLTRLVAFAAAGLRAGPPSDDRSGAEGAR
jgi:AcrR family transcriptional regulator